MKKHSKWIVAVLLYAMIFSVTGVSATEPVAYDFVKISAQNQAVPLQAADFGRNYYDFDSELITKIKIVDLPSGWSEGKVLLDGKKVSKNQEILLSDMDRLCFQPKKNFKGQAVIHFQASDGKEYSNTAKMCIIIDPNTAVSTSAHVADREIAVYKNSPKIMDVLEGATLIGERKVSLVSKPANGVVDISSKSDGTLVYTPNEDYTGDDQFTFKVTDAYKNERTATVKIMVADNDAAVQTSGSADSVQMVYSDLNNHWAEYSVMKLAENGIITGEKLKNNTAFYKPEEVMNRAEFLNLVLASVGTHVESKEAEAVSADLGSEPAWVRETMQTAYEKGILSGYEEDGKISFKPYDPITRAEAAVIINKVVNPAVATCVDVTYEDMGTIPTWAAQSVKNMTCYGIIKGSANQFMPDEMVTRAQAAELCYQTMKYLSNQNLLK